MPTGWLLLVLIAGPNAATPAVAQLGPFADMTACMSAADKLGVNHTPQRQGACLPQSLEQSR